MFGSVLEVISETEKSKVYLIYDNTRKCVAVEKHLAGEIRIYETLCKINHPFLPEIYDVKYENGETVVVEEYIAGKSIAKVKISKQQIKKWFYEVCEVLAILHKKGIIHRDIKPSNLLIGNDGHIRLIDFDAARKEKADQERDTRLLGTHGYAPPEQYGFAQTDERADIYALGITFREILGDDAKKGYWKHILRKCTELEPKKRYRSISNLKTAMIAKWIQQKIILPLIVIAIFAAVAVSGFLIWSYNSDADVKEAFTAVFEAERVQIFSHVDIEKYKADDQSFVMFHGDEEEIYKRITKAMPGKTFISTGCSAEGGYLLFGGFTVSYDMYTGARKFKSFDGLYYMDTAKTVKRIMPDECDKYAYAVLKLYALPIFD